MIDKQQYAEVDKNLELAYHMEIRTVVCSSIIGVLIAAGAILLGPQKVTIIALIGFFTLLIAHCLNDRAEKKLARDEGHNLSDGLRVSADR